MSDMSKGKKLLGSFVVGGAIGAVMQIVYVGIKSALPAAMSSLAAAVTLVILGILGMILVLTGAYAKITAVGGYGASIMFSGLVDALSGIYLGARMKTGKTSAAVAAALKFAAMILGTIIVVATLLGVVSVQAFPMVMGNFAAAQEPGAMGFVWAFLCGGVIGITGQLMLEFTKMPMPAVILLQAAIGAIIAVSGSFGALETLCGAGLICTVVDGAGGLVSGGALWASAGVPMQSMIIILVMAIVVVLGIITGAILATRAVKDPTSVPMPEHRG